MKITKNRKSIAIVFIFAVLLVLPIATYLSRGWIRTTVLPGTISALYASDLQNTMDQQINELNNPFSSLGYKTIDKQTARCVLTRASSIRSEVTCVSHYHAYTLTPQDPIQKAVLAEDIKKLEKSFMDKGWVAGPYSTLSEATDIIINGNGATGGAGFDKTIDKIHCAFGTNAAFATPNPNAISSDFYCSRTVHIVGNPWQEAERVAPGPVLLPNDHF